MVEGSILFAKFVVIALTLLAVALIVRRFGQPSIIGYILVGVVLGPYALDYFGESEIVGLLGEVGIMLLLFFVGMEISLPELFKRWKISIFGTALQIVISVLAILALGHFLGWPWQRSILIGFVISLSSTAVILKLLEERNELKSRIGQNVLGVLIMQDLAIVPMLILISFLGGVGVTPLSISLQVIGGILFCGIAVFALRAKTVNLKFLKLEDQELEVFAALVAGLGLAYIASLFHLSPALGAFIGGILIGRAKQTQWIHDVLHPFRIVFVATFFVSVGMLINIQFVLDYLWVILIMVGVVLVTNTFINAIIFYLLGESKSESLYSGALLSQIGEFSFLLAATGVASGLILDFGYQMTIAIIAVSLLVSPLWARMFMKLTKHTYR